MNSIHLRQYLATYNEKIGCGPLAGNFLFTGRQTSFAKKLGDGALKQLATETCVIVQIEAFAMDMFRYYKVTNASKDQVMMARCTFLSLVGKLAIKIGQNLEMASFNSLGGFGNSGT